MIPTRLEIITITTCVSPGSLNVNGPRAFTIRVNDEMPQRLSCMLHGGRCSAGRHGDATNIVAVMSAAKEYLYADGDMDGLL